MARRRAGVWAAVAALWLAAGFGGGASAQTPAGEQYGVGGGEIPALEARVEEQEASLEARIGEISAIGAELEEAQSRVDGARARAGELGDQTRSLQRELASRRESFEAAKAGYEEQARAAYKGGDLAGLSSLLGGLLGSGKGLASVADPRLAGILLEGREILEAYREAEDTLRNSSRQISGKRRAYEVALREEREQTAVLRRHEQELEEAIARITSRKAQTESRLSELRAAERARILEQKAATAAGSRQRAYELGIARGDIVARAVEPISEEAYRKLYREAAREYGFAEDWYILAAVGKVESDHGANMGPSTAGAMGPMQFLPSTWETSGVDGDGDGVANIMDPEDAIPAAAGYLQKGGAPQDWYAALFSYNHADWYVVKVLGVAEGYRRLAKDDTVGPYI
ncbi:MAG TPA: lytic murein transglycosylase [Rubrobacteraceae bacterium]|nr:lytic murein transglycosylase [Rubrobacteraceae bacterium]